MFLLHEDPTARGFRAAGLIRERDLQVVGGQRFKTDSPCFATPDFDDVMVHALVFLVTGAQRDVQPGNSDCVAFARSAQNRSWWIIRRNGQFGLLGIDGFYTHDIALYIHKFSFDPTGFVPTDSLHVDPISIVEATDDLQTIALEQAKKVKVRPAWSITAG